ncbi:MAG: glutamate--cysteine ligase, partial [Burkholderiales bacterium]
MNACQRRPADVGYNAGFRACPMTVPHLTTALFNDAVAEPVVYMMDFGGFYRVHNDRGTDENLNAPAMH